MSKTSRSRLGRLDCWHSADAWGFSNVLRLVLCTQPRSEAGGALILVTGEMVARQLFRRCPNSKHQQHGDQINTSASVIAMLGIMDARRTILSLAWVIMLSATGCESVTDISHDKRYATDYAVGDVYRTRQPLYFWVGALTAKRHYDVTDTLEAGSQVRITKIEADYGGPEMGTRMVVTGCILDGKHVGQQVELWPISRFQVQRHPSCAVYFVDTNFVERVSQ